MNICCNGSGKLVIASFFVEGQPKGQPRIKASRAGGGKFVRMYTPNTADNWKDCIKLAARQHRPKDPLDQIPIIVHATWILPRPGSRPKWLTKESWKSGEQYPHLGKPDRDNLDKSLLDAMTDIGYWRDDSLVHSGTLTKLVAGTTDRTGCQVVIEIDTNFIDPQKVCEIKNNLFFEQK